MLTMIIIKYCMHILHTQLNTTQAASAEVWRQKETERANHLESALEEATATVVQLKSQLTNSSGSLDTAVAPLRKQKLELELTLTEAQRKVQVLELEVQRIEVKHKADLSALQIEVASKVTYTMSSAVFMLHVIAGGVALLSRERPFNLSHITAGSKCICSLCLQ
jgi:chromosome segregation ATPase